MRGWTGSQSRPSSQRWFQFLHVHLPAPTVQVGEFPSLPLCGWPRVNRCSTLPLSRSACESPVMFTTDIIYMLMRRLNWRGGAAGWEGVGRRTCVKLICEGWYLMGRHKLCACVPECITVTSKSCLEDFHESALCLIKRFVIVSVISYIN